MIIKLNNPVMNENIASFDYDHTLVKPKNGREFPKDVNDWVWFRESVPKKLKELHARGFSVVVFTTQTKTWKIDMIKNSLEPLDIPITIVIGFGDTEVKKPNKKLFDDVITAFNKETSFYVGDAYGEGSWSDTDLKFAENVGITFMKPEVYFPIPIDTSIGNSDTYMKDYIVQHQEIAIMIGYPASGKSTFAKGKLGEHILIQGDVLKTTPKMIKASRQYLKEGKSVVIDATNGKKANRKMFIDLGKEFHIPVRCFVMNTSIEKSMELNENRAVVANVKKIPKIAYYTFRKYYEEPTSDEGDVIHIDL